MIRKVLMCAIALFFCASSAVVAQISYDAAAPTAAPVPTAAPTPSPLATGAANSVAKFTGANAVGVSNISDNGTAITIGTGGTAVKKWAPTTCSVDPPSLTALTAGSATCTVTGVAVADPVFCSPPSTLNSGLVFRGCTVTGTDTVTFYFYNLDPLATINDSAGTWVVLWIDL